MLANFRALSRIKSMSSAKEVGKWFKDHITDNDGKVYSLDKHQAAIVSDAHKNTEVTARAGSGKTRTIVAKIVYLLKHDHLSPDEIIVFAFNKKAKTEINERLATIRYDHQPLFKKPPSIATTFHAFAYQTLGGKKQLSGKIISEWTEYCLLKESVIKYCPDIKDQKLLHKYIGTAKQFIIRAEQKFFKDYDKLHQKISAITDEDTKTELLTLEKILNSYHCALAEKELINFNQMVATAAKELTNPTSYRYIFVDEYQDFSLLFLELIKSLRKTCKDAKLLAVGDDWQAINRFAGSDVEYFTHFERYFREDCKKLFIPTNYRSGKAIVRNANFFMSKALKDYNGCKSGNKLKASIYFKDTKYWEKDDVQDKIPLLIKNYLEIIVSIIKENPGKTIKILHRNNDLNFNDWPLEKFIKLLKSLIIKEAILTESAADALISYSTIHRSKGLESDIVVLLEVDAGKFPSKDKTGGLFKIFGDDKKTLFQDEIRLFYVALTRPKEQLYILSKTTKIAKDTKNFFSYLNQEWLEEYQATHLSSRSFSGEPSS